MNDTDSHLVKALLRPRPSPPLVSTSITLGNKIRVVLADGPTDTVLNENVEEVVHADSEAFAHWDRHVRPLVSARPHIVLKKIPFASEEVLPLVMLSDKDSHGNSLVTVYPSTYDDAGIETLEIHSNYHWIPHIPAMMRELSEDYEEVFFGSTRSTVSHATQHRYDAFVKEREKYIEDELKHAYKCILWENNMDWDYDDY
ncbi:hypothetical protein CPB85DRAFT_1252658 [Mucidula mucida]|nr:hypothetical protein CPB85DRAFT_1252658 [Mucidula mucida]